MIRPALLIAPTLLLVALAGCSQATLDPPSLAHRAAEDIDPRLGVEHVQTVSPVSPALTARLADLLRQVRGGDAGFQKLLGPTRAAAAKAGTSRGESWIAAQQLLSALEAARAPSAQAAGAIDALSGEAVAAKGDIPAADLAAIQAANDQAGEITRRQSADVAALSAQIGN